MVALELPGTWNLDEQTPRSAPRHVQATSTTPARVPWLAAWVSECLGFMAMTSIHLSTNLPIYLAIYLIYQKHIHTPIDLPSGSGLPIYPSQFVSASILYTHITSHNLKILISILSYIYICTVPTKTIYLSIYLAIQIAIHPSILLHLQIYSTVLSTLFQFQSIYSGDSMSASPLPLFHCSILFNGSLLCCWHLRPPSRWYQLGPASGGYSAALPSGHRVLPYWLRWWQPSPGFTTGPEKLRQVFGYPSDQTRLIGFGQVEHEILFTGVRNHHKWKTWKVSWSIPPCAPPFHPALVPWRCCGTCRCQSLEQPSWGRTKVQYQILNSIPKLKSVKTIVCVQPLSAKKH